MIELHRKIHDGYQTEQYIDISIREDMSRHLFIGIREHLFTFTKGKL
jgi:hypothetical protein